MNARLEHSAVKIDLNLFAGGGNVVVTHISIIEYELQLRQIYCFSPPPQTVLKVSARVEKSVPLYRGDYEFSILTGGTFTFKTVSPYG